MGKRHYIIPIFVPHEGCPHDCVFCNQGKITGENKEIILGPKYKQENKVNSDFVRKTIEEYIETIGEGDRVLEVSFFGGTFTAIDINKQRELLAVAKEYKDKKIIDYIRLSTRPDYIDEFILDHLKSYKVDIIELGVQSLDKEVLHKSGRGHGYDEVLKASKLIKEYGFTLGHQIMVGLPEDTFEKDIETTRESIKMKPDICRIYPALTVKNTPMEDMYLEGTYKPYTLEEAVYISAKLYKMYKENNIQVIRIRLQPTDNIALGKDIVDGPFHPAFRELVESSIINENIYNILKDKSGEVTIRISNKSVSKLYADKKRYFNELKDKAQNCNLKVKVDNSMEVDKINIEVESKVYKIDL